MCEQRSSLALDADGMFPRVRELRGTMRDFGLDETAIIMAGGVWFLREWNDWIDNLYLLTGAAYYLRKQQRYSWSISLYSRSIHFTL